MVYLTGDTQGDFCRIADFCKRFETSVDDVMIILGDAGINFSGGQKQRLLIARALAACPEILILDEPTRGIDVGAREEIYRIIYDMAGEGKTILVVSSDLTEILKICQRIVVMYEGRITGELTGEERTEHNIMSLAADVQAE